MITINSTANVSINIDILSEEMCLLSIRNLGNEPAVFQSIENAEALIVSSTVLAVGKGDKIKMRKGLLSLIGTKGKELVT